MNRGKVIAISVAAVCIIGVIGALAFMAHRQSSDYAEAVKLAQNGDTQTAYTLFEKLGDYSDSKEQRDALVATDPALPYRAANKGDIVTFGTWEQDGDKANGSEPISWIVLDRVDEKLLVLSEMCLDGRPYNPAEFTSVTWEKCELRSWLNGEFLEGAFSETEQALIPEVKNENEDRLGADDEDDPMHEIFADGGTGTEQMGVGGADTRDRVFCLSETDTLIYLNSDVAHESLGKAKLVDAASARGARASEEGYVGWWLRSPGVYSFTAQFVNENGEPYPSGAYVELTYGVRPSLWIDVRESATESQEN